MHALERRLRHLEWLTLAPLEDEGGSPLVIRVAGGLPGEAQHAQIGVHGAAYVLWREPDESLEAFEERAISKATETGAGLCVIGGLPPGQLMSPVLPAGSSLPVRHLSHGLVLDPTRVGLSG
jgi:hypothetical protein